MVRYKQKGSNNPNYGNIGIISGENHFLNKMSKEDREMWLCKYLKGENNYQKKLTKQQLLDKNHVHRMSEDQYIKYCESFKGDNNPYHKKFIQEPDKYRLIKKQTGINHRCDKSKLAKEYIFTNVNTREQIYCKSITKFRDYLLKEFNIKISCGIFTRIAKGNYVKDNYKGFYCRYYNKQDEDTSQVYNCI